MYIYVCIHIYIYTYPNTHTYNTHTYIYSLLNRGQLDSESEEDCADAGILVGYDHEMQPIMRTRSGSMRPRTASLQTQASVSFFLGCIL